MPNKPKRQCSYPGCSTLTNGRHCEKHQKDLDAQGVRYERAPAKKKRYGRAWKRIRDRYIAAHPQCEICSELGTRTAAEEVHHILPLSKGGTSAVENLMSLCSACHKSITVRDGCRRAENNADMEGC